ncbi:tyrosine-type recombinase/integrase [Thalassospira lucentensis]|uniref:tyrosine-type recombinase/integrase n=1 Tax=Thalassospira lucentensis TaxID=168935 RepID=UPI003D2BF6ED
MTGRKQPLSNLTCKNAAPEGKEYVVWDTLTNGFFLKVSPTGRKTFGLYYRSSTGKQRRPKIGSFPEIKTSAAREIAQRWLYEVAVGKDPSAERTEARNSTELTVRDLADRHMREHVQVKKKEGESRSNDERNLRLHILPAIGDRRVSEIEHDDIFKLHRQLQAKYAVNGNRVVSLLSKMFNNAELWKMRDYGSNPCRFIQLDLEEERERDLEDWEWIALAKAIDEYEKYQLGNVAICWLIRLIIFTGTRRGEIMSAPLSAIDMKREVLIPLDHKGSTLGKSRKKKRKEIVLNSFALKVIEDRLKHPRWKDNPWLIPGRPATATDGSVIHKHMINPKKPWEKIKKMAGITDLRIHDLRHAFATVGIDDNIDMTMIQKLLGHSKIETTMRYAHRRHDAQRKTQDRIANAISARMRGSES